MTGVSDPRLTPLKDIAIIYRNIASKKSIIPYLGYTDTHGHPELRKTLAGYLNKTRGLKISKDNILITRGSQMGIYLSAKLLLQTNRLYCGRRNKIM